MTKAPTILAVTDDDRPQLSARKKNDARAALVRIGWIGTTIAVSVDVFAASLAVAIGLWWSSTSQQLPSSWWLVALFVPLVVGVLSWVSKSAVPDDVGVYLNHMLTSALALTAGSPDSVVLPLLSSDADV